tara:strand:+ start:1578 stop:1856 length:279 start_codon:yes stop_codon:yes gene_type:complete
MNPKDILMNELEEIAKEEAIIEMRQKDIKNGLSSFYDSLHTIDKIREYKVFRDRKSSTEQDFYHDLISSLFDLATVVESQQSIIEILLKDRE